MGRKMNKQEWKAAEAKAIEGLTGATRSAAKKAFYEANRDAIRAAHDDAARAETAARNAPMDALIAKAARMGMRAHPTANIGYVRGSSHQTVVLVYGGDENLMKSHGATWNKREGVMVFPSVEAFKSFIES